MSNTTPKDPNRTFLEVVHHILQSHPALHERVLEICHQISGKKDEFKINVAKWFNDQGDATLRLEYPLGADSVVFDLGGYEGDFADAINKKYNCFVYVFEPSKTFFEQCLKRFENNSKIKCFNFGYSNESGEFILSNEANASSMIKNSHGASGEKILIKDICDAFSEFPIKNIDLLKINIEGPEFLILDKLIATNLISRVSNLQVQFHEFFPNSWKLRDDIRIKLGLTHIEMWNYPFVWESWKIKV